MEDNNKTEALKTEVFDLARAEYTDTAAKEIGLPSMESMKIMKRVATELAGTPFCPKGFAGNPAAIFAAILTGKEMLLSPMQSLRAFWPSPDGKTAAMPLTTGGDRMPDQNINTQRE